ncbi:MAG: hypothetical protein ACM3XZ_05205 [Betaproteobacteria bacterium]
MKLARIRVDPDDALIVAGTVLAAVGLWGIDWRLSLVLLGLWLIFLGGRKGGK